MKLTTIAQKTTVFLGLVALATPLAIATGCAPKGEIRGEMVAPQGAGKQEAAYDLGYRQGARDVDTHETSDYARHNRSFEAATEKSYATGYTDGFSGVRNRYGAPEARDWMRQDNPDSN